MPLLAKKEMSEEDIKLNYVTPTLINKGWADKITMETAVKFTDGCISLSGNKTFRQNPKKADYILYKKAGFPLAVVEAKDNKHTVSHGIQQAIEYARKLEVPFAYSSNGDAFYEHDFLTGKEREIPLSSFPTPDELYTRCLNEGKIDKETEKVLSEPFYTGQNTYAPRYYQRIAVNRTLKAIAKGKKRLLLVMATGTGKTYTAFQIISRLLKSGLKRKILYLADRNVLVDQSIAQDFAPLKKTIHKINFASDNRTTITAYEVYFSLYQQLVGDDDIEHCSELFRPDFFDLVIVDECHRGSAKADSRWRKILEYFKDATQIGMTATPKETAYISNIDYFGDSVFEYSLKDGIKDGFLAPFKVINIKTNIGDGWQPYKGQKDIYGNEIPDRIYNNTDYDYNIIIKERIEEVAHEITEYLKFKDRMAKTIVFCANEEHAERMRAALVNLNADMVKKNPDYVVRITGSDQYGISKLDYFISVNEPYPVIATTSELLATGVDCKMVKLIVLDKNIGSMTEFKQIIGRGTRIREKDGKLSFAVMDFRNVTRLFYDKKWDGPIEQDPDYPPKEPPEPPNPPPEPKNPPPGPPPPPVKPVVDKDGCQVYVTTKVVSVYNTDGKLLKTEDIIDYTRKNILGTYATLEKFISMWSSSLKKTEITDRFREFGIDLAELKASQNMSDVDDFDFISFVAFGAKAKSRRERAENVKKRDFLNKYSAEARKVLEILLDKYADTGISELENSSVLTLAPLNLYGKPSRISAFFGGREAYEKAVSELKEHIYEAG